LAVCACRVIGGDAAPAVDGAIASSSAVTRVLHALSARAFVSVRISGSPSF
jgi:hypothetical protein